MAQPIIHVATTGNDQNNGSEQQPFLSIAKAVNYAEKLNGNITIRIHEGTYYLPQTIFINESEFKPQSLQIEGQGEVVISAAKKLQLQWKHFKNGIYRAQIADNLSFERLYCNKQLQVLARYPNYDSLVPIFNGVAEDAISPARVAKWRNPKGGYVHALHDRDWGGFHYLITGKNEKGELQMEGGWQNNRPSAIHKEKRFVENIFEELDAPNEWFFDKAERWLYFYPPKNINPNNAIIEVAQLNESFVIKGSVEHPIQNISFQGLHFTQNERTFMQTKEPLLRSDWTFYRGGALLFDGAENCSVKDCSFDNLGGNAIVFSNYNKHQLVTGCHIYNIGANGVSFIGDMNAVRSPSFKYADYVLYSQLDKTPGPLTKNYPQQCTVNDNLLHNLGQIEKQATAVQIEVASEITVSHNSIYHLPRAGINIGDGCFGGHLIEYNDVFNTVLETGDHGSFNSWGRDRFWAAQRKYMDSLVEAHPELILLDAQKTTIIRNNRWRCDHGWDVDLDDGSSNYYIYNNLFLNGGLKFREGFFRKAENNIIINNSFHPHVWFKNSHDVFKHNIVMQAYAGIGMNYWGDTIDQNLFPDKMALEKAQDNGTDKNSIAGDPLFIDPANGNFNVQAHSPALKIGFKNFDLTTVGVQKPSLKKIALQPKIPTLLTATYLQKSTAIEFEGGWIKTVEGPGDRSAYGLPDETGVIIMSAGKNKLKKMNLSTDDVIIAINDKKIINVKELTTIYNSLQRLNKPIKFSIIRNQQLIHLK